MNNKPASMQTPQRFVATDAQLSNLAPSIARLQDRIEIVDALYRFGAGQDLRDPVLLASAFSVDAELDFIQPAKRLGVDIDIFRSRDVIVASIGAALQELDTTHTVTNMRVDFNADRASMFALVEAQHLPTGDHSRHLLLKNIYRMFLRPAGGQWLITHLRIENVWYHGDPGVLFPR
jgi:hypothetical protein